MQQITRRAIAATLVMLAAAAAAHILTPHTKLAQQDGGLSLTSAIPDAFGPWKLDKRTYASVINPQAEQLVKATYNQTLSRVYLDDNGHRVMMSIAYGENQTDSGNEIHHPEVCYPAQGFSISQQSLGEIKTSIGNIRTRRLITNLGKTRIEPVTYWIMIGTKVALTGLEKKIAELRHGLRGEIVDGLLFRISTIDADSERAFQIQDQFVRDLIPALSPLNRARLAGLS
jgi:EpsI family protein